MSMNVTMQHMFQSLENISNQIEFCNEKGYCYQKICTGIDNKKKQNVQRGCRYLIHIC
jgi:hypothetical protein